MSDASMRSLDRRRLALRRANEIRHQRAQLKQDLREGTVRLDEILAIRPCYLATAEVLDLLVAVPKIGPARAARLLKNARVSQSTTIGGLSDRQCACLIELLGSVPDPTRSSPSANRQRP